MRKAILAFCCVAALGVATLGETAASEARGGENVVKMTEHHWGGGYRRGGWGGGHRGGGWGGGCSGGGYYYGG